MTISSSTQGTAMKKKHPLRQSCSYPFLLIFLSITAAFTTLATLSTPLLGKGLDQISDQNPANQPAPAPTTPEAGVSQPTSTLSQSIAGKVFLATSTGFVQANKSRGKWRSSRGASDLVIGYKLSEVPLSFPVFATYRYAPVAVTGNEKGREYRGVWETHALGALGKYALSPEFDGIGGGEVGFTVIHLQSLDSLEEEKDAGKNGISFTVLGGLEYKILESRLTVGPRIHLGFGTTQIYQLAVSGGFYF